MARSRNKTSGVLFRKFADQFEQSPDGRFYAPGLFHLRRHFGNRQVRTITESAVVEYGVRRQSEGASSRTINRTELHVLMKVLKLAHAAGAIKEFWVPFVSKTRDEEVAEANLAQASAQYHPLRNLRFEAAAAPPKQPAKRTGRPPQLTDEEYEKHSVKDYSDPRNAARLSRELRRPISHDQVRRARGRSATRNAK